MGATVVAARTVSLGAALIVFIVETVGGAAAPALSPVKEAKAGACCVSDAAIEAKGMGLCVGAAVNFRRTG